jgi:hypothetical protein
VARLQSRGPDLEIAHDKEFVEEAPVYPESHGALPPADNAELFSYYQLPRPQFGAPHAARPDHAGEDGGEQAPRRWPSVDWQKERYG